MAILARRSNTEVGRSLHKLLFGDTFCVMERSLPNLIDEAGNTGWLRLAPAHAGLARYEEQKVSQAVQTAT